MKPIEPVEPNQPVIAVIDPSVALPYAELAGACEGVPAITRAEYEARIEQVRARLHQRRLAAVIVESGPDMLWLGGPRWGRSERALLLVIPVRGEARLVGPAFEAGTLKARAGGLDFPFDPWDEHEDPHALALAALADSRSPRGTVVVGSDTRSFVVEGLRRTAPRRGFQPATDVIEPLRRRKSPAELAILRRVNEVTKRAIAAAATRLREGMQEHGFAAEMSAALSAAGLTDTWVLPLFGPNAAYPHGTPQGRALADGDLVLVDTGGFLHGYASDITRTWAFGDPAAVDDRRRAAWHTVRAAQAAALAAIRPGVRCAEVDAAARAVIAAAGFDGDYRHFTHRLGHGIGMQVHEPPYLVRNAEHRLEPGNTMSNEPGLYLPGEFGIRLEDIVAVTEDGAEVFGPLAESLERPFG
ncbi:MAG: aminopeptidase P family protein [Nannocystis sp.]|nr:Xaa-Pro peptidase family protein [Nannocystis sp.]MBA3547120.1 aminopeptidase P family protein [Nannocystis sp.]